MTDITERAAGWHPDPFGRHPLRWWDGSGWTAYAGDGTNVQWDDEPVADRPARPPGLAGIGIAAIGMAGGVALSFAIGALLVAAGRPGGRPALLGLSELGLWSGLVGACIVVSRRRGTGSLVRDFSFRFRWSDIGFGFAGAVVGRVVSAMVLAPIPFPARSLRDVDHSVLERGVHGIAGWGVLVVVTCVGAPLVEELFFRGLVQSRLVERYGAVPGIVVASVLFGSAHMIAWNGPMTLAYAWAVAGGGLVLGITWHVSGRLGTSIMAHAFFNAQAMIAVALLR